MEEERVDGMKRKPRNIVYTSSCHRRVIFVFKDKVQFCSTYGQVHSSCGTVLLILDTWECKVPRNFIESRIQKAKYYSVFSSGVLCLFNVSTKMHLCTESNLIRNEGNSNKALLKKQTTPVSLSKYF